MKITKLSTGLWFILCVLPIVATFSQSGDQILDGIGETDLIARYTYKNDARDWSRNNLHATIHGEGVKFINDELFGRVLSLPGEKDAFVTIPSEVLKGVESISVSGWINLRETADKQRFFDFGKKGESIIYYEAELPADRWNHIAVVLDIASKKTLKYLNGKRVGEEIINQDLNSLFENYSEENTELFIGKAIDGENTSLNAKVHDFRIYRIPLSENQVTTIFNNSSRGESGGVRTRRERDPNLPVFAENTPQFYNQFLIDVKEVHIDTYAGHLPRLPRYLKGSYKTGIEGPDVRVIWPAPENNKQVQKPGTYTVSGTIPGSDIKPKAIITVRAHPTPPSPGEKLMVFSLDQVSLTADNQGHLTKFIENRDKFIKGLSETNPDNFLFMFRNAFGQPQPEGAAPLKGWDSQETKLRGHATGHYLTALAQAYAGSRHDISLQENFAQKMDYMVNTLHRLSQLSGRPQSSGGQFISDPLEVLPGTGKNEFNSDLSTEGIRTDFWNWGEGFISAYPPDQFIMLEKGASYGGDNSKIWAPYYTLHKILAGLMDIYDVSGNTKALEIVKGMGNWVYSRLSHVPTETLISMWNRYIAGEFGGMNEAMARLYRLTGESRYLECATLFDNIRLFYGDAEHTHGLAKNVDMFRGLHANQHIPQIMGALEIFRGSKSPDYYYIADNFWNMATNDYMYSIGGVAGARNPANAECFTSQPSSLYENGFSAGGQNETCATYNMLKLTRNLFLFDQRPELMDYYERGLYNHILASVDENTAANTYHVPLRPGSRKHFGNHDMNGFTCCNGTALESNTKLQNSIYFKSADNSALYVNLFVPSTLDWADRNISIIQSTSFPKEEHTSLSIRGKGKFELKIRVPKWATKGFFVKINGVDHKVEAQPGSYLSIKRKWKNGDVIELHMPFEFHLEPVMDQQNLASLFYGPVLLAAQETGARKDWRKIALHADDLGKTITGDPQKLEFMIDGVEFKPFYESYGPYSVYLDVLLKN